jgi:hypothetical protein
VELQRSFQNETAQTNVFFFYFSSNCSSRVPWLKNSSSGPPYFGCVRSGSNKVQKHWMFLALRLLLSNICFSKTAELSFYSSKKSLTVHVLARVCSDSKALVRVLCFLLFASNSLKYKSKQGRPTCIIDMEADLCLFSPWLKKV